MKHLLITLLALSTYGTVVWASDDHNLLEVCKSECPQAQTEEESHACMKEVVKKKKSDKKFRKSDCHEAVREHEKHEKKAGHKH